METSRHNFDKEPFGHPEVFADHHAIEGDSDGYGRGELSSGDSAVLDSEGNAEYDQDAYDSSGPESSGGMEAA